jgi:hypothetical protein
MSRDGTIREVGVRLGFTIIRSLNALMGYRIKVSSKIGEVFASSLPV